MIAQEGEHIGAGHHVLKDPDPVRAPVDDISRDVEGVLGAEVDDLQDPAIFVVATVGVGDRISKK